MTDADTETLFDFPCQFPIKVMGVNDDQFTSIVIEIVAKHVADLSEDSVKSKASKNGKFISLTVTIEAQSKQHVDAIYMELTAHDRVLMAL